ncbi:unnamed protein product [Durusdinium trenchii]|uniref:Uncharacterized protein n=1 Tax=Durusdinium trenchii TaxID=1381693 RepID=A0ABP0T0R7_9DINO
MVLECGFHGAVHGLFELLVAEARNSQHLWTISGLDGTSFQLPATDGSVASTAKSPKAPRFPSAFPVQILPDYQVSPCLASVPQIFLKILKSEGEGSLRLCPIPIPCKGGRHSHFSSPTRSSQVPGIKVATTIGLPHRFFHGFDS